MSSFRALDTHPCVYWLFIASHLCGIVCAATPPYSELPVSYSLLRYNFQEHLFLKQSFISTVNMYFSSPCLKQTLPLAP